MPRRDRAGSVKSGNSGSDRLEPKLLKAVESDDLPRVKEVLEEAQSVPRQSPHLLEIGLTRACDKNHVRIARFLLSWGANPDYVPQSRQPNLVRAAEHGSADLVNVFIEQNANLEAKDKKGRTALMTAAWKDHFDVVSLLLTNGADVHTVDKRKRNVLHNVAADRIDFSKPARRRCSMQIVEYILQAGINLDKPDELGRTALHWSCVTDNDELLTILLMTRFTGGASRADVNATDSRMKTPLHLAASHNRAHLARILLDHGASVGARSDGGWTALHNACEHDSLPLIEAILEAGADVNSELLNGRTALHVAAEFGNAAAVRLLLEQDDVKRSIKDRFGNTPLLMAAQHKRREIVEMLAPWNNIDALSSYEIEAAKAFSATIVDFGNFRGENRVTKRSVFDLLYGRDPRDSTKHAVSTMPKNIKATSLRWIHLPANQVSWCENLLTKRFIEEGANDVEGYKALEASFSHQHRGQQHHSRFMRPMCQVVQRTPADNEQIITESKNEIPPILVSEPGTLPNIPGSPSLPPEGSRAMDLPRSPNSRNHAQNESPVVAGASTPRSPRPKPKAGQSGSGSRDQGKPTKRQVSKQLSKSSTDTQTTASSKKSAGSSCNIYLFMPYLHFETDKRRREMQTAMKNAESLEGRALLTQDEVLIHAHLTASTSVLHIRRTLDQYFYSGIDCEERDCDQVVYRFQKQHREGPDVDPKIYMVDQLWMWILGKDLVVTCFPQRWRQPRNDPLNVLEGIIEDINSKTREPVQNVYELATIISGRCFGTFDRYMKSDEGFLDMFEDSIGGVMDREASLFQEFSKASRQASAWLQQQQRPNRFTRNLEKELKTPEADAVTSDHLHFDDEHTRGRQPLFVDRLLDVGAETDLLAEIKDIRDELDIIGMVLDHQKHLLPELRDAIKGIYKDERSHQQLRKIEKAYDDQVKTIANPLKDIARMDKQGEKVSSSIENLLRMKNNYANAFEARFARDAAAGTVRQGQILMVFTIVTVVFLPLSTIASIFAINIKNFPHRADGTQEMTLSFVSEYIFGIGLAISIPCIVIALSVDEVGFAVSGVKRRARLLWAKWKSRRNNPDAEYQLQTLRIEQSLSMARSARHSVEVNWRGLPLEGANGRKPLKDHWDVERGG